MEIRSPMDFIKPDLVYSPGLSVGQNDGFANKLGLSPIEFGEDCARSLVGEWHDVARMGCKGACVTHENGHLVATHGNEMSSGNLVCPSITNERLRRAHHAAQPVWSARSRDCVKSRCCLLCHLMSALQRLNDFNHHSGRLLADFGDLLT